MPKDLASISLVLEFKQVQHHLPAPGETEVTELGLVDAFPCSAHSEQIKNPSSQFPPEEGKNY